MVQVSAQSNLPEAISAHKSGKNRAAKPGGLSKLFASLLSNAREPGSKPEAVRAQSQASKAKIPDVSRSESPKNVASTRLQGQGPDVGSSRIARPGAEILKPSNGDEGRIANQPAAMAFRKSEPSTVKKETPDEPLSDRLAESRKEKRTRAQAEDGNPLVALHAVQGNRTGQNAPVRQQGKSDDEVASVDTKRRDRRKDRIDIEVYDYRTPSNTAKNGDTGKTDIVAPKGEGREADMTLTLRPESSAKEGSTASSRAEGQSFSDALARELREVYNADIVKHASVVLKNGGEGLIRLALKPEMLGSVKIHLELADNKIAGHILVESNEALKAFEREMASLEQAFKDGGFDGASINLSVSSDGAGRGSGQGFQPEEKRPFFSGRLAASTYDTALPGIDGTTAPELSGSATSYVDLLA